MFGSNYNITIFLLATESMGQMKCGQIVKSLLSVHIVWFVKAPFYDYVF